ncbi:MAG: hypothetical protein NZ703_11435 [Gemmataceae bacterium]|nr:hypothetical protein [Gemmataceae bacterium]MCS7271684.1 hypothetical protein [Gemmataceae bacterium]MDW8243305.1 hypothetical protein [Thermogemmata sp.]
MNRLGGHEAAGFARRYQFRGGRIRRVQMRYQRGGLTQVIFDLWVRSGHRSGGPSADTPIRLRLRLERVAEFRFQMRPNRPRRIIEEARFGYLQGLFYLMFDAWGLEPGETARVHDYRASEVYAAGQELYWEELPLPPADATNGGEEKTVPPPSAGPSSVVPPAE